MATDDNTGDLPLLRTKMPELDSVRGVAILAVFFYHGLFWSNNLVGLSGISRFVVNITRFGWLGVNLFFVLSGFLITGTLEDSKTSRHFFRRFYSRRALRILPAYYALLLFLAVVPSQNKAYLVLSFFYLSNMAPLLHIRNTYAMLWSLAVEEHFYLIWPFLVWFLQKRALVLTVLGLFLVSPLLRAAWFSDPLPNGFHGFTWLVSDGFAAGAALALLLRDPWLNRRRLAYIAAITVAVATTAFILGSPFGILTRFRFVGATFMLSAVNLLFFGTIAFTLLVGTIHGRSSVVSTVLSFYGEISYGLYLIHWLVFTLYDATAERFFGPSSAFGGNFRLLSLRCATVLIIATLVAWLSRKYFEERFLRLKSRYS